MIPAGRSPACAGAGPRAWMLAGTALLISACSAAGPRPTTVPAAGAGHGYRALFRIRVEGPSGVERFRLAAAVLPPDRLRLEVFGPAGGTRLLVATDGLRVLAIDPSARSYAESPAGREEVDRLLGIPLLPGEIAALLLGSPMCAPGDVRQQVKTKGAVAFGRTVAWCDVECPPGEIRYRARAQERGGSLLGATIQAGLSGDILLEVEYGDHEEGFGPRWPKRIVVKVPRRRSTLELQAVEGPAAGTMDPQIFTPAIPGGFQETPAPTATGLLGSTAEREK